MPQQPPQQAPGRVPGYAPVGPQPQPQAQAQGQAQGDGESRGNKNSAKDAAAARALGDAVYADDSWTLQRLVAGETRPAVLYEGLRAAIATGNTTAIRKISELYGDRAASPAPAASPSPVPRQGVFGRLGSVFGRASAPAPAPVPSSPLRVVELPHELRAALLHQSVDPGVPADTTVTAFAALMPPLYGQPSEQRKVADVATVLDLMDAILRRRDGDVARLTWYLLGNARASPPLTFIRGLAELSADPAPNTPRASSLRERRVRLDALEALRQVSLANSLYGSKEDHGELEKLSSELDGSGYQAAAVALRSNS